MKILVPLLLLVVFAGCSSSGSGPQWPIDSPFRDHLPVAVEHARQSVLKVEGVLPDPVQPRLSVIPGAPCSGYWCAVHPDGSLARGWNDLQANHIYIAGPPDGVWTPDALAKGYNVCTHEALHSYVPWHDPRYDAYAPFWREARQTTGKRASFAEEICPVGRDLDEEHRKAGEMQ